ncbi:CrcB family protein [Pelagibacterium lacus]|uniref:Fluoride-specific ion channel FluC n=1 Tax=Pelagibacterium lacus TaxID=2282655 RepID=A0A369W2D7_9HYPH|nr:CrcB family protein [Pelagibacterium lacus]RDE08199.1 chromosome condensation protein CrcB [Pelagibacterium lacus]
MADFLPVLSVALGGALGAVLRHVVAASVTRWLGHGTLGTLAVNASGALIIGGAAGLALGPDGALASDALVWLAGVTGVLGSYTTVSSFSLQTLELVHTGRFSWALANIAASLILCLSLASIGFALVLGVRLAA